MNLDSSWENQEQHTAASTRKGLKEYQVSKVSKIATEKWKKANQDSFFGKEFPQRGWLLSDSEAELKSSHHEYGDVENERRGSPNAQTWMENLHTKDL